MKYSKEIIRKTMQAVESSGSAIEVKPAKELWHKGLRYRKNDKTVLGKPDITFKRFKIAIKEETENNGHNIWQFKEKARKQCTL